MLLLYALARLKHDGKTEVTFTAAEAIFRPLLRSYGPWGSGAHVSYPYGRLVNDGLWLLPDRAQLVDANGNVREAVARDRNAPAGFSPEVLATFERAPELIDVVALHLLDRHFAPGLHDEILEAIGLELGAPLARTTLRFPGADVMVAEIRRPGPATAATTRFPREDQILLSGLEHGPLFWFSDWSVAAVPRSGAIVYTIWNRTGHFIYVGMAGRGETLTGRGIGPFGRLASHASGRRSGDQFRVYVCDRLVLPTVRYALVTASGSSSRPAQRPVRQLVQ